MSVKYIPNGNTKIVIDKTTYQNDGDKKAVLPSDKISKDELDCLLKAKLIRKLELDESTNSASEGEKESKPKAKPDKNKPPKGKPREELLKEAAEAGLSITNEMTDEEIQKLIADAKAK